ncbi:MAG TPA: hypothetical protein G4O14_02775 [Anaerolineae bacterium]|nr:hypothetical protein [Anaerolineae bacterium]
MATVREGDRKKTGMKGGKYPVATVAQCLSAIKLRHHGKGVSASSVLAHVARSKHGKNPRVQAALKKAREADKKKK